MFDTPESDMSKRGSLRRMFGRFEFEGSPIELFLEHALGGARKRPVTFLFAAIGLTAALPAALYMPLAAPLAGNGVSFAQQNVNAIQAYPTVASEEALDAVRIRAITNLQDARSVADSWERLGWLSWILVIVAILIVLGVLSGKIRKWVPGSSIVIVAAGALALLGDYSIPSELDLGITQYALGSFAFAVLALTFATSVDSACTAADRHGELIVAIETAMRAPNKN